MIRSYVTWITGPDSRIEEAWFCLFRGSEVSLSFYNIPDTRLHHLEDGMVTLFIYFFFFNLRDIYLPSHNASHGYEWLNLTSPQGNIAVLHPMKNCDIWSQR